MQEQILKIVRKVFPQVVTFKWRSPKWGGVRKEYLKKYPKCACCNSIKRLNVHHIRPFHLFPDLELVLENLISLCKNCHIVVGHLDNWASFNITVRTDAAYMNKKVRRRP